MEAAQDPATLTEASAIADVLLTCRKAVELARQVSPTSVITLEEEWGDYLSSQKQMDAAINHYIEAGCTIKAVEAAIADRQCAKAAGIVEFLQPSKAAPYHKRIAQLYEEANNRFVMGQHAATLAEQPTAMSAAPTYNSFSSRPRHINKRLTFELLGCHTQARS